MYLPFFVKSTHQKAANSTFLLILPVGMVPCWFLGGKFMDTVIAKGPCVTLGSKNVFVISACDDTVKKVGLFLMLRFFKIDF